jgi:hypothetical protein
VDPQPRGPDWMKISPVAGSLFHEKRQDKDCFCTPSVPRAVAMVHRQNKRVHRLSVERPAFLSHAFDPSLHDPRATVA